MAALTAILACGLASAATDASVEPQMAPADQDGGGGRQRERLAAAPVPAGRGFYFTRAIYTGYRRGWADSWAIDYPKADRQFLIGVQRLTNIDAYERENPIRFDDPELRRYPYVYALEVGYMSLTDEEVRGLREYLLAGGFLVIDDFWGTWEWRNFGPPVAELVL
jgi:hypothetical protein